MSIDLPNLIGKFADYRSDDKWDRHVTIQGCCWPPGSQLPQLIATDRVDGTFIVDSIKRFKVR